MGVKLEHEGNFGRLKNAYNNFFPTNLNAEHLIIKKNIYEIFIIMGKYVFGGCELQIWFKENNRLASIV